MCVCDGLNGSSDCRNRVRVWLDPETAICNVRITVEIVGYVRPAQILIFYIPMPSSRIFLRVCS